LFVRLTIVLILSALLVAAVRFVFLGLDRIVAHPLRVISLLLIMLTLLFVGYGLRTAHLGAPFLLIGRGSEAKHHKA
jgi:hypothetical protein